MLQVKVIEKSAENSLVSADTVRIQIPSRTLSGPFPIDVTNFSGLVSTITVETMLTMDGGGAAFRFGNGNVELDCCGMISQGEDGIEELRRLARAVLRCCKAAMEGASTVKLTPKHRAYFAGLLRDFENNGLVMPRFGKIEL